MYLIRDIINDYYNNNVPIYSLNSSQSKALDIIIKAYRQHNVGLVQGPPGTGKTSVIIKAIDKLLGKLSNNEVIIYVAPTNELVYNALKITVPLLREYGYALNDIKKVIRVFGSDFNYKDYPEIRSPINKDVKVILTTDYQKFYIEYKEAQDRGFSFTFLVDEASKSPIYKFLTPIALELLKADKGISSLSVDSLSVVGDPMQAIAAKDIYKTHKDLLLMISLLAGIISHYDQSLAEQIRNSRGNIYSILNNYTNIIDKLNEFIMLDETYRLPAPSHEIISKSFYLGKLSASSNIKDRLTYSQLKDLEKDCVISDKIGKEILDAVKNEKGIIYIDVKGLAYRDFKGENVDKKRAIASVKAAIAASIVSGKSTTIIPLYRDMASYIEFLIRICEKFASCIHKLNERKIEISVSTAHALLGAENENIVVVLGKEYPGLDANSLYLTTMYFNEPEIFNVQFSRHRNLLIVIGNMERLYRETNKLIRKLYNTKGVVGKLLYENSIILKKASKEFLELCSIEIKGNKTTLRNSEYCKTIKID
ncbi:MAG: AAA domain-containing protein [Sulfolobus sp.]